MNSGLSAEMWKRMAEGDRARLLKARKKHAAPKPTKSARQQKLSDERARQKALQTERQILDELALEAQIQEFQQIMASTNEDSIPISTYD